MKEQQFKKVLLIRFDSFSGMIFATQEVLQWPKMDGFASAVKDHKERIKSTGIQRNGL